MKFISRRTNLKHIRLDSNDNNTSINSANELFLIVDAILKRIPDCDSKCLDFKAPCQEDQDAVEFMIEKAIFGHNHYRFKLATAFYVNQRYIEALFWFNLCAKDNDHRAMNNIGVMFNKGLGVARNIEMSIKWLKLACVSGNLVYLNNISIMLLKTTEEECHRDAVKYLKVSTKSKHPTSLNNLGCCYARGTGISMNLSKAKKLFIKGFENGSIISAYNLGVMYNKGIGTKQSIEKARNYFNIVYQNKNHTEYRKLEKVMHKDEEKLVLLTTLTCIFK